MTDEQFKELMEKLDRIEKQMAAGDWNKYFRPPPSPYLPQQPNWDGYPSWWRNQSTD